MKARGSFVVAIWGLALLAWVAVAAAQTATKRAVIGYLGSSAPSVEPH